MLPLRKMKRFCFSLLFLLASGWLTGVLAAQEPPPRVRFCAYNVKNYLRMPRFVAGERIEGVGKPEAEKQAVVKCLVSINADVIGLSEIGDKKDLADLQQRLKEQGSDYPYSAHTHGGDPLRCLAVLSRLPIIATDTQKNLTYKIGDQVFPVQRGILDFTIQVAAKEQLRCLGIHFKSKREVTEADEALMRRNEAWLLRQYVERILEEDAVKHLLVYGDFNSHNHEAAVMEVRGPMGQANSLTDLKVADTRGQTWTHYWEAADTYSRFDYFFMNSTLLKKAERDDSYIYDIADFQSASDHRPIVATFHFGESRRKASKVKARQ